MLPFSKIYRVVVLLDFTPYTFDTVLVFLLQPLITFRQDYSVYIFGWSRPQSTRVTSYKRQLRVSVTRMSVISDEHVSASTPLGAISNTQTIIYH